MHVETAMDASHALYTEVNELQIAIIPSPRILFNVRHADHEDVLNRIIHVRMEQTLCEVRA